MADAGAGHRPARGRSARAGGLAPARDGRLVVRIDATSDREQLEALLPLIAGYQYFYGVDSPDDERNRSFFGRFVPPGAGGLLLGAWDGDSAVGFACVYFRPESVAARDVAYLHDLYVGDAARGRGVGRALIDRAAAEARSRGFSSLSWQTAIDNRPAQRLYESYDAERTTWFEYEVDLSDG